MNTHSTKLIKNQQVRELADRAIEVLEPHDPDYRQEWFDIEKFAKLIVFDMLSELTNDDDLGAARIDTIRRLAQRFGVERTHHNPRGKLG